MFRSVFFASCLLLSAGTLHAQDKMGAASAEQNKKSSTLDKIRGYRTMYIGHRESSIPFSYFDANNQVVGYSMDLCARVIEAVKTTLAMPDLAVVMVPSTSNSRQILMETGTTDLQCGSVTNTTQRQRYVAFSVTTFVTGIRALVKKDSNIRSVADMRDKIVVTTSGTTSDAYVRSAAAKQNVFLNYKTAPDHREALRSLLNGQADVFVLDEVLLKGLLLDLPDGDAWKLSVLDRDLGQEPYGLMFRRNDPVFKKLVDDTLVAMMKSGEMTRLYDKWFLSPIPPKGKSLDLPMSSALKQLMITPNDRGV